MPWSVQHRDSAVGERAHNFLPPGHACIASKNEFVNYIVTNSIHPRQASQDLGNLGFETVARSSGNVESSIRLSREHRLYFVYDEQKEVMEITQIGGHD
mmetsp:Transcript_1107/g.3165  ORF Transcript_1107/g.3165 Transcript_1107/m.3165 type:complete len:99 (-) Transcript_1107:187-483(-)